MRLRETCAAANEELAKHGNATAAGPSPRTRAYSNRAMNFHARQCFAKTQASGRQPKPPINCARAKAGAARFHARQCFAINKAQGSGRQPTTTSSRRSPRKTASDRAGRGRHPRSAWPGDAEREACCGGRLKRHCPTDAPRPTTTRSMTSQSSSHSASSCVFDAVSFLVAHHDARSRAAAQRRRTEKGWK